MATVVSSRMTSTLPLEAAAAAKLAPRRVVSRVARMQLASATSDPARLTHIREQMSYLLGHRGSPLDIGEAATRYLNWEIWRRKARRHPQRLLAFRVTGLENLLQARKHAGGTVAPMHFEPYEGIGATVRQAGSPRVELPMHSRCLELWPRPADRQDGRLIVAQSNVHDATTGLRGVIEPLEAGIVVSMAIDGPGSAELDLVGRRGFGASGAAVADIRPNTAIVPRTHECEGNRWVVRIHPALDPSTFSSPQALMRKPINVHKSHALAIPEALLDPIHLFGSPESP